MTAAFGLAQVSVACVFAHQRDTVTELSWRNTFASKGKKILETNKVLYYAWYTS